MLPQRVSHYLIKEKVGSGGMGLVYRAYDEILRRDVALKLLADKIVSHSDRWSRILAEARAASALNHPGITTIYEVGEDQEQLFIVMELVPGKSLREMLLGGPVEHRALVRLVIQVAEALTVAHSQGVVHGDIKPENIMVQPDGRVKILDFGLARQLASEALTVSRTISQDWLQGGQIAGTIAYMAPEILRNQSSDARADLFSLGVVLYEMANGRKPFLAGSGLSLAMCVVNDTPPPLTGGATSPELSRIIFKLLEKDPESRYQSAREVQVDLNNLARDLELGTKLPATLGNKSAVAVLPFKLLTPHPEDEYLSVALTDPLISRLNAGAKLLVRPISAVMRYAKQGTDVLLAGRELNVQLVIDGSIQKFGQRLRVHVQAWNITDGSTLMSAKYDADATELFDLQDKIGDSLARALTLPALPGNSGIPPTENPVAYELFMRAKERMSRNNRWDTRTAIEMLENATKLDNKFSDGWACLAEACVLMGVTFEPGPRWMKRAERAVTTALALDEENVEAQVARGRIYWTPAMKFQNRAALRAIRKALQREPTNQQALSWQGCIFAHIGLLVEAKECLTTALAASPDDTFTLVFLAQTAMWSGNYDEAQELFARALSIDRANLWANLFAPTAPLYSGELEKAVVCIRSASHVLPKDPLILACEALLCAKKGDRQKAEQLIQKAVRGGKSLSHTHHMMHTVAAAYAVLEKPTQALSWLRKASVTGLPLYPGFRDDPHFVSLHNNAKFLSLMSTVKKEWLSYQREFGNEI
jgi:serine/threonine protein kinase/Flp pilus assembly protein TadD